MRGFLQSPRPPRNTMRLLVYNIRYATGTGPAFHLPVPGAGYLRSSRQVLERITAIHQVRRTRTSSAWSRSIPARCAPAWSTRPSTSPTRLGTTPTYQCKYGATSINQLVPIVRKQGNAFLAAPRVHGERFHYFDTGIKRLIIELELDEVCVFLVHLSLKFRHRQYQLRYLHELVEAVHQAGDRRRRFQHLLGRARDLPVHAGLGAAQRQRERPALLPSRSPRMELDFILYSDGIEVDHFAVAGGTLLGSPAADLRFRSHRAGRRERPIEAYDDAPPVALLETPMSQASHWRLETDADRVAWLDPRPAGSSANSLSADVMRELDERLARARARRAAAWSSAPARPTDSSPAPTSRNSPALHDTASRPTS